MPDHPAPTAALARVPLDPLMLLQTAVERGVTAEQLEKLVSLQERYEANVAAAEFGRALAAFQAEMPPVHKGRDVKNKGGGSVRYRFAAFEDVMAVAQPLLSKHGISLSFTEDVGEKASEAGEVTAKITMTMRVRVGRHFEDKTVSAPIPNVPELARGGGMNEPQALGLVLSYFKRYCLLGGLNIVVTDEDTDAVVKAEPIGREAVVEVLRLFEQCERAGKPVNQDAFLKWIGAKSVQDIRRADFQKAVAELKRKLAQNGGAK